MRILFTSIPSSGHFHPLVPLARAAAAAGHAVAFAAGASFCPTVEAAGFRCFPAGFDWHGKQLADLFPQARGMAGAELARFFGIDVLVNTEARALVPDLLAVARTWPPDLIVRETAQYGGCVAAEVLGIPHASVRTNVSTASYGRRHLVADALTALRAAFGLPADPDGTSPFRYLHLAFEPPGFWPPDEPLPPTYHLLRPVPYDRTGVDAVPPWVAALPDAPTVCATLGTVSNRATEVFAAILEGLREAGMNLILTVGRNGDPAEFGLQPANVHIERYIPLSLLLPHCDVVVSQGGFSTVTTTLLHGLPMALIPLWADQPVNAQTCARLGVGITVAPDRLTSETIGAATRALLAEPLYRENARRVRDAMAAMPGPEYAVALLERLAAEKRPLFATS